MGMIKSGNYINIQGFMVKDLGLKGNELLVYAIIYGFSQDGETHFTGSLQYLADWTNSTKQGVLKNLKSLLEKKLIQRVDVEKNRVKFVEYYTTEFNEGIKQSLTGGIKQSLTNNIDIDNINNKEIYKESFEEFWREFPKQRAGSKKKAYKSYCLAIKEKRVTPEKMLEVVKKYSRSGEVERGYAKGCAAWINDDRFNCEYEEEKGFKIMF
jgi:DNA-binding MarR family transcriptional regulator